MRDLILRSIVLLIAVTMLANTTINTSQAVTEDNPLLAKWEGPYGGIPPFDRVQVPLFKPALEAAMAEQLAEIQRIANDPAPPNFENTIVALETSGSALDRVSTLYGVWGSTMATPDYQAVQREMAPRLAAFNDQITQNEALFKRIEAVYNSPAKAKMTP
jgi:peptidyl-dipeptidase Dcp